jgi:hypothetical protein
VPTDQTSDLFELDMYLDKILEEWETRAPIIVEDKDWDIKGLEEEWFTERWLVRRKNGNIDWECGDYVDTNTWSRISRLKSYNQEQFSFNITPSQTYNKRMKLQNYYKMTSMQCHAGIEFPHNAYFVPTHKRKKL